MNLKPLSNKIVVKRDEAEGKTPGGIVIPDVAKKKTKTGRVLAVGPGKMSDKGERVPCSVLGSERVLFSAYAGNDVEVDGKEYLIIADDEVMAVLD